MRAIIFILGKQQNPLAWTKLDILRKKWRENKEKNSLREQESWTPPSRSRCHQHPCSLILLGDDGAAWLTRTSSRVSKFD
ncbi:MAG: hypothetical protein ACTSP4_09375 [Candidatus Hodarchaeales archaeon]